VPKLTYVGHVEACLHASEHVAEQPSKRPKHSGEAGVAQPLPSAAAAVPPLPLRFRPPLPPQRAYGQHTGKACPSAPAQLAALHDYHSAIEGHLVLQDFLSEAEEDELVARVEGQSSPPWHESHFNGRSRGKSWGVHMNLQQRVVSEATVAFPDWLSPLVARMRVTLPFLEKWDPNHVNAIEYVRERGHYLRAHVDDRELSGDIIVNVSLLGACTMTYTPLGGGKSAVHAQPVRVSLPRRCVQVQSGAARYGWTHEIAGSDLEEARRVSLTLRESPLTKSGTKD